MIIDWSVIICAYNSSIDNLIKTVDSILMQKNVNYEIIIADDCSKVNHEQELTDYVRKFDNVRFKYVYNEVNVGTVKNIINALSHCSGQYVKPIGSGDMLFSANALEQVGKYMKENNAKVCFTKAKAYIEPNGEIQVSDFNTPLVLEPYKEKNMKKINKNLVLYGDQISGAVTFYEKDTMSKYLNILKDTVIYVEDFMPKFISCDNLPIYFYDEYCVYYQFGTGISTKKTKSNNQRLINDLISMQKLLYQYAPNNINVQNLKYINELDGYGKVKRILMKLVRCPELYIHFAKAKYYQRKNFSKWKKINSFFEEEN